MPMSAAYRALYQRSIDDPAGFWGEQAQRIEWQTPYSAVLDDSRLPFAKWFVGGRTNLCHNAIDRHLAPSARKWRQLLLLGQLLVGFCWALFAMQSCATCSGDSFALYKGTVLLVAICITAMSSFMLPRAVLFSFAPATVALAVTAALTHKPSDIALTAGVSTQVTAKVSRDGEPVSTLQPYLGAYGHLVALREGDLAYLHVHPEGAEPQGDRTGGPAVSFAATAPTAGRYLLYLDFKVDDTVHTATFVVDAARGDTNQPSPESPGDTGHAGGH